MVSMRTKLTMVSQSISASILILIQEPYSTINRRCLADCMWNGSEFDFGITRAIILVFRGNEIDAILPDHRSYDGIDAYGDGIYANVGKQVICNFAN